MLEAMAEYYVEEKQKLYLNSAVEDLKNDSAGVEEKQKLYLNNDTLTRRKKVKSLKRNKSCI